MKKTPDEVKAQVVAALLTGQGVNEVARTYRLDKSTVSRIKRELPAERFQLLATQKHVRLDELILELVETNIRALIAYATTTSEPEYIRKQAAESVGVMLGIVSDKTFRLLEAAAAAASAEPEPTDGDQQGGG